MKQASQTKALAAQIPFTCLTSQSRCEVNTDVGTFVVEFSGQFDNGKVKTELPFELRLTFNAITQTAQLKSVSSFLEGKTMFMGKVPVFFEMANENNHSVIAKTLLASCSEEVMTWRLWLTVEIEQEGVSAQQEFFIDFDSQRL